MSTSVDQLPAAPQPAAPTPGRPPRRTDAGTVSRTPAGGARPAAASTDALGRCLARAVAARAANCGTDRALLQRLPMPAATSPRAIVSGVTISLATVRHIRDRHAPPAAQGASEFLPDIWEDLYNGLAQAIEHGYSRSNAPRPGTVYEMGFDVPVGISGETGDEVYGLRVIVSDGRVVTAHPIPW